LVQPDWTVCWHNGFLQLPRAAAEHVQRGLMRADLALRSVAA
jgi:hypothetical protein